ncbi:hypothetical protein Zmor_002610 [Zophobas morio]|uniref:Reverse transcriptase domain-containing protein n=2 Tax=Zophobas morio TaxID=2755281 RepID=A0AA38J4Y7_9CUCU|nr:hypothetical protein Zmor_002610 [Zophobas morio]
MDELEKDNKNNVKLYQYIRKQNRKQTIVNIDSKDWEKHFQKLLRRDYDADIMDQNQIVYRDTSDEQYLPTKEEYFNVLKCLKMNKEGGIDGIVNEMFKYGGQILEEKMYELITSIWITEKMPREWDTGIIIPILKKGKPHLCTNYRGISLLNAAYKLLTSLINKKLQEITETEVGEYQYGFRRGRSTIDAIHSMNQIIEKCCEHNINIHILFVDFKQAFDSINRDAMVQDMEKMGIPRKLINLVRMCIKNSKAVVAAKNGNSEEFAFNAGVRQGDGMSATLFNIVMDRIVKNTHAEGTIINKSVQIIAYADDLALIARDKESLSKLLAVITNEASKRGLDINVEKTKYLSTSKRQEGRDKKEIVIGNFKFEIVENFRYLGSIIDNEGKRQVEITQRIQSGHRAYFKYSSIMKSSRISKDTKLRVYKAAIRSVVTYAAETMSLTRDAEEKMSRFERKIVRRIMGMKKIQDQEYRTLMNHEIEDILKGENIVRAIKARRIRWYGHLKRMEKNKHARKITEWNPDNNRSRGRPKIRWEDQVRKDLSKLDIQEWSKKIQDRTQWKEIVEQAKTYRQL